MTSLAIWCSRKNSEPISPKIEAHFNLWKLDKRNDFDCFLDFGLMLENAANIDHINIFIPKQIDKSNLEDLGKTFKGNTDLVSALFNEEYRVTTSAGNKVIDVLCAEGRASFYIYILDLDNDIAIENAFNGSIIKMRVPPELAGKKHYYRMRLRHSYVDSITYVDKPPNSPLESAFFVTELVDFRVNDKRDLNESLLERIRTEGEIKFSKIHFFLMRNASDDYVYSYRPPSSSRKLEDVWRKYVAENYSLARTIAYDWKESGELPSFSAFAKFKSLRCSFWTILVFILVIIALGILSSFLGSILYGLIMKVASASTPTPPPAG
jgi:hypothetical protein